MAKVKEQSETATIIDDLLISSDLPQPIFPTFEIFFWITSGFISVSIFVKL
jgi:hypothetical protein